MSRRLLLGDDQAWTYWVGLLVPAVAWGARLLAGWAVAEHACATGTVLTPGYILIQTGLIVSHVLISAWAGVVSYRVWRAHVAGDGDLDPADARGFLGLSGVLSSAIFTLLIVVEGSAVYLVPC